MLAEMGCGSSEQGRTHPSWEEFERRSTRIFEGTTSYVVEGDLPVTHEELRDYYKRNIAAEVPLDSSGTLRQPLIVNRVNSQDDIWYGISRRNLRYCVSNEFGVSKLRAVSEMSQATSAWEAVADIDFIYDSTHDANCNNGNTAITFSVRPWTGGGACAFFPSGGGCVPRTIVIDFNDLDTHPFYQQNAPNVTTLGIFRHELGHVLGFRHEHIRVACYEDNSWSALTIYDASSVMHYPWCNGVLTSDLSITNLDAQGAHFLYPRSTLWRGPHSDLNGDGKIDILFAEDGYNLGISNGGALATYSRIGFGISKNGPIGYRAWVGDFDGNGKADILFHESGYPLGISYGGNLGTYARLGWRLSENNGRGPVAWVGDFDGDGKADILFHESGYPLGISYGSNLGVYSRIGFSVSENNGTGPAVWVGDFNGDRRTDIVFAEDGYPLGISYGGSLHTYNRLGFGISKNGTLGYRAWVGDFDGDGRSDFLFHERGYALGISYGSSLGVYSRIGFSVSENNGTGPAVWVGDFKISR